MNFPRQNSTSDNRLLNLDDTLLQNINIDEIEKEIVCKGRKRKKVAVNMDIDDLENTLKSSVTAKTETNRHLFNRPLQLYENFKPHFLIHQNVGKDVKYNKPRLASTNKSVSKYFSDQRSSTYENVQTSQNSLQISNPVTDKGYEKLNTNSNTRRAATHSQSPLRTSQKLFLGSRSTSKTSSSKTIQKNNSENSCSIFSTNENNINKKEISQEVDEFSQFYKSSQVARQIDDIILQVQEGNISSYSVKCKSSDNTEIAASKDVNFQASQLPNSSDSRKEISQMFEKIEQTICKLGPDRVNDLKNCSLLSEAMFNGFSQEAGIACFENDLNKILRENANKTVVSQVHVNRTINMTAPTFQEIGSFYGLPNKVKELIRLYKGIDKFYDWQDECLNLLAAKLRKNLIYSLPTSGGKTLVAEVLILREVICRKRNVIFVLPYVAIVQEKVWALSPFAVALDFLVEEYAAGKGNYPPKKRRYKNSVYVATTEKALGLINSLVEMGRLEELGLIIVDELHLIGDAQRGSVLEILLTKLMVLNDDIQIVGMSATIGNLTDIGKFLNAEIYSRNFRPVELIEYVKCGNQICKVNWNADISQFFELVRTTDFSYGQDYIKIDPDHLGGLVMEVIPAGSCLIFCPSKQNCENVTLLLCKVLTRTLKQYKLKEKEHLLKSLQNDIGTICDILKASILYGIAYHHSGLTTEERRLIEEAYRAGILCVICCTSTLATGVNLPARRVIIRKPYIAQDFINLSRYKQMVGRAGRAGLGENGDSILICNPEEFHRVKELLMAPMDQTLSQLHMFNCKYLEQLYLSCIALGTTNTYAELEKVTTSTLLSVQKQKLEVDIVQLMRKVITRLFRLGGIQLFTDANQSTSRGYSSDIYISDTTCSLENIENKTLKKRINLGNETKLILSKLGNAALKGGLNLEQAHTLHHDLRMAQKCLILIDCLHLLYLVIPYSLVDQIKPSTNQYYNIMIKLNDRERQTAKILGISDSCIIRIISNQACKNVPLNVLNRFYMALVLYELWNEVPITEVSTKYELNRGFLQTLMTSAASFSINVINFCEQLEEFWPFVYLLKGMNERLAHCCSKEILPLMELPAVKQSRAKQLYNAGFKSLQSIAKADPNVLVNVIEYMSYKVANQLIAAAKMLLLKKIETLREEAEDVVDGIDNPLFICNQTFPLK